MVIKIHIKNLKKLTILILLILIFNLSGCLNSTENIPLTKNGIDFFYTNLEGNTEKLSDHRGKIVILDL